MGNRAKLPWQWDSSGAPWGAVFLQRAPGRNFKIQAIDCGRPSTGVMAYPSAIPPEPPQDCRRFDSNDAERGWPVPRETCREGRSSPELHRRGRTRREDDIRGRIAAYFKGVAVLGDNLLPRSLERCRPCPFWHAGTTEASLNAMLDIPGRSRRRRTRIPVKERNPPLPGPGRSSPRGGRTE